MKKTIKKYLCALLAVTMLISITACTDGKTPDESLVESDTNETAGEDTELMPEIKYEGIDHVIDIPEGQDITVLQLADTQAMLYEGIRKSFLDENGSSYEYSGRFDQVHSAFFQSGVTDTYTRTWQYVEEGVKKTNPDIIVLTGDNIYGETDDSGELWLEMIEVLDSFEIPWLCIFGNHDNESQMGVHWQAEAVEKSEYGYMKNGDLKNGNSNYTVGIRQGDRLKYVFYMLDTNGCRVQPNNLGEGILSYNPDIDDIRQQIGLYPDQFEWIKSCGEKISAYGSEIPSMMFLHVPPIEAYHAVMNTYGRSYTNFPFYPDKGEDKGVVMEAVGGFDTNGKLMEAAETVNCAGMFMGHQHKVAMSIFYNGIRLTYGLKTGTGDYHDPDMLGTTKITISETDNSFDVEYIFSEIEYPLD